MKSTYELCIFFVALSPVFVVLTTLFLLGNMPEGVSHLNNKNNLEDQQSTSLFVEVSRLFLKVNKQTAI